MKLFGIRISRILKPQLWQCGSGAVYPYQKSREYVTFSGNTEPKIWIGSLRYTCLGSIAYTMDPVEHSPDCMWYWWQLFIISGTVIEQGLSTINSRGIVYGKSFFSSNYLPRSASIWSSTEAPTLSSLECSPWRLLECEEISSSWLSQKKQKCKVHRQALAKIPWKPHQRKLTRCQLCDEDEEIRSIEIAQPLIVGLRTLTVRDMLRSRHQYSPYPLSRHTANI